MDTYQLNTEQTFNSNKQNPKPQDPQNPKTLNPKPINPKPINPKEEATELLSLAWAATAAPAISAWVGAPAGLCSGFRVYIQVYSQRLRAA